LDDGTAIFSAQECEHYATVLDWAITHLKAVPGEKFTLSQVKDLRRRLCGASEATEN